MTDLPERLSLLPSWVGPLPRAVAKVEGRLDDLDMDRVVRARDIARCSDVQLLYLAAERSVDVYDPAWPRPIREAVVASAPEVHATKGTPHAIRTALRAMRVTARLTEWWQTTPRGTPGTFAVIALAGTRLYPDVPVLDERTVQAIRTSVSRTKAHARPFDLTLGVLLTADVGTGVAAVALRVEDRALDAGPVTTFVAETGTAVASVALHKEDRGLDAGPVTSFAAEIGTATAGLALQVEDRALDAGPVTTFAAEIGTATAGLALQLEDRALDAGPVTACAAEIRMAAAGVALLILSFSAEAS